MAELPNRSLSSGTDTWKNMWSFCGLMKPRELFVLNSKKPVWRKSGAGTKRQARALRTLEWAQGSASNERMTHECLRNCHVNATYVTVMTPIHYMIQHREEKCRKFYINSKINGFPSFGPMHGWKSKGLSYPKLDLVLLKDVPPAELQCRKFWKSNQQAKHYCLHSFILSFSHSGLFQSACKWCVQADILGLHQ